MTANSLAYEGEHSWKAHFEINEGKIIGKTKIGLATIKVLDLNNPDRIILRKELQLEGRY